jgi:flagellar motor switch protein FliN/FliY
MTKNQQIEFSQVSNQPTGEPLLPIDLALIGHLEVALQANIGKCQLKVADLYNMRKGNILVFDSKVEDLIDITLNSHVVARGRLVAQDGCFALEVVETAIDSTYP